MTDEFTELENELKQLRPKSLPAPLLGRIATELAEAPAKRGFFATWRTWVLPAAAAAALAVAVTSIPFLVSRRGPETTEPPVAGTRTTAPSAGTNVANVANEKFRPVRATNVLYDAVNEGVVRLDDDSLARRMRLNYLDTITWEDPRSGASLQRTVPREEIVFIPVTAN